MVTVEGGAVKFSIGLTINFPRIFSCTSARSDIKEMDCEEGLRTSTAVLVDTISVNVLVALLAYGHGRRERSASE